MTKASRNKHFDSRMLLLPTADDHDYGDHHLNNMNSDSKMNFAKPLINGNGSISIHLSDSSDFSSLEDIIPMHGRRKKSAFSRKK